MKSLTLAAAGLFGLGACARDVVGPDVPVAVALDFLPFPAVVVEDTLRDTTGAVAPVRARAFNYLGEELPGIDFSYLILDRGATIDTATGVVTGDSIRSNPVRVVALFDGLQTQTQQLAIVPQPGLLETVAGVDTLEYSVSDTTQNVSRALSVRLLSSGGEPVPVASWIVTFDIVHVAADSLATIAEGSRASRIDTTAMDGTASRQVRLHVEKLVAAEDSIVLHARARYRGTDVNGSPARLVVYIRPRAP